MTDDRELARNLALGRLAFGAAMVLLPGAMAKRWVGPDGGRSGTKVITRGFGARDIALAMATLDALDDGRPVGQLIELGVLCDAVDAGSALFAGGSVPWTKRILTVLVAGAATALGIRLAGTLD